nr:protease inhibitor I42 family protein [Lysobacter lactosilyticus]
MAACNASSGAPDHGATQPDVRPQATACHQAMGSPLGPRRIVDIDARNAHAPIRINVGDVLRVVLPASPATGHAWSLDERVPAFLCVESDPGNRAMSPSGAADTWTFRAHDTGRGLLQFSFSRHGLTDATDARATTFDVRVE